jgi:hypothetical protein
MRRGAWPTGDLARPRLHLVRMPPGPVAESVAHIEQVIARDQAIDRAAGAADGARAVLSDGASLLLVTCLLAVGVIAMPGLGTMLAWCGLVSLETVRQAWVRDRRVRNEKRCRLPRAKAKLIE